MEPYIFFTPAIDMLLFAGIMYSLAYIVYSVVYKKDFETVTSVDLRFSVAMIFLIIAYYYDSGIRVTLGDFSMHWLIYYLVISGLIEIVLFLIYRRVVGLKWKDMMDESR